MHPSFLYYIKSLLQANLHIQLFVSKQKEGGGSKLYRNNIGELGFVASNMGMEGSLAAITTRRSEITSDGSSGGCATSGGRGRKKRGRPRKYDSNGNFIRRESVQASPSNHQRGRQHAMGDVHAGMKFTPHVIHVYTGEDVVEKVVAPFETGPRCVSILSATGMAYNVEIRQPASTSYAHLLKYEGIFEILRLSGSFNISEDGIIQIGGLSVLLSRADGHVIGGTLGGSLLAATPVQMVVGSFIPTTKRKHPKKSHHYELRMRTAPNIVRDPEPTPIPMETNDVGTSYNKKKKEKSSSLVPSWNVKPSPDLNVDASDQKYSPS